MTPLYICQVYDRISCCTSEDMESIKQGLEKDRWLQPGDKLKEKPEKMGGEIRWHSSPGHRRSVLRPSFIRSQPRWSYSGSTWKASTKHVIAFFSLTFLTRLYIQCMQSLHTFKSKITLSLINTIWPVTSLWCRRNLLKHSGQNIFKLSRPLIYKSYKEKFKAPLVYDSFLTEQKWVISE